MKKQEHIIEDGEYSGYVDVYGNELCLGDKVTLLGREFEVMYYCGAWGIGSPTGAENIPWCELKQYLPPAPYNYSRRFFSDADCFITFWELAYNYTLDGDYESEIPLINGSSDDPEYIFMDWKKENTKNEK